ncbi:serine hydrolase [Neobacillus dielmonensis]|uniref:serine hydrolase n=1 Tax=Neobacillus dielmonensis TaxID=1347369 RepID=UPI0005A6580E|nr:serine hydrolase [Neobacillus dielmonensis]
MHPLEVKIAEELIEFKGRIGLAIEIGNVRLDFNSQDVFPSASVIKVPILIEGLRQCDAGLINLDELIRIENRAGGSGVLESLSSEARLTLLDLLTLMITVSDNTATNMLIDRLGIESINRTITKIGMTGTVLNRKMMDFEAKERGLDNKTSAADMVCCLKAMNEGSILSETSRSLALKIMHAQQFQDKLPAMMDLDKIYVANKTGSLPKVENDCAIMAYNDQTAYVAILTDELDEPYTARQVISRIGKYIYDYMVKAK